MFFWSCPARCPIGPLSVWPPRATNRCSLLQDHLCGRRSHARDRLLFQGGPSQPRKRRMPMSAWWSQNQEPSDGPCRPFLHSVWSEGHRQAVLLRHCFLMTTHGSPGGINQSSPPVQPRQLFTSSAVSGPLSLQIFKSMLAHDCLC